MPGMASYMLFDVAVAGLYAAQVLRPGPVVSRNTHQLTLLWVLLTAWPILLFFLADGDLIIELVGLRANIYLLPFVLFGPRLNGGDLRRGYKGSPRSRIRPTFQSGSVAA